MENILKAVTWNMRYIYDGEDGKNSFIYRAGMIYDKISKELPDIIAMQEIVPESLVLLKKLLPEYRFYGHFKEADYVSGGGMFTAIRESSIDLIALETFWISPAPYIPGSRFLSQSQVKRTCVALKIYHKASGKLVRVMNAHLDDISSDARKLGIKCILDMASEYSKRLELPLILMGDFNERHGGNVSDAIKSHGLCDITNDIGTTFHGYGEENESIDYICVSPLLSDSLVCVGKWEDEKNGIYLSDHYPVYAQIKLI